MTLKGLINFKIPQAPRDGFNQASGPQTGSQVFYDRIAAALDAGSSVGVTAHAGSGNSRVWKFANADVPFYVFVTHQTALPGTNPTPFASVGYRLWGTNDHSEGGVGIQVAMRQDGGDPWTGTTVPLWNVSQEKYVWPRSNGPGGAHATNKNNFMPIVTRFDMRWSGATGHVVFDENNLVILADYGHDLSYSTFFYFGKVNTYPNTLHEYPWGEFTYACTHRYGGGWLYTYIDYVGDGTVNNPYIYGSINGNTVAEGGVALPTGSLNSATQRAQSGVKGFALDLPIFLFNRNFYEDLTSKFFPNTCFGQPQKYDTFEPNICLFEYPRGYGHIGPLSFWKATMGIPTHDTTSDFSLAAFGNGPDYSIKALIPWSTTAPTTGSTDAGEALS